VTDGSSLDRSSLDGPVLEVARLLLGARLTTVRADGTVTVRLTEVEAYGGAEDPGSHAHRGRTARNASMFGPPGHLYVYRHLGLHRCVNVVVGPAGTPAAVLLRAGEVVQGAEIAAARRSAEGVTRGPRDLARGPARLAVALGIEPGWDGLDLLDPAGRVRLALAEPHGGVDWTRGIVSDHDVVRDGAGTAPTHRSGPRVGVTGPGGRADRFPWRLWLADEPTVSAYRPAPARRTTAPRPPSGTAD